MVFKVENVSKILGYNKAVAMNTNLPSKTLEKKHNDVAYHKQEKNLPLVFPLLEIFTEQKNIGQTNCRGAMESAGGGMRAQGNQRAHEKYKKTLE